MSREPNHLEGQTSPYLLQHLYNPVDWYPWGPEALARARDEDKPIFLSIGYAACHWCHVMERETFENGEIAEFLGEHFVAIKVDREERPDLDDIYMNSVQLMTGQGGWPLNVFLTPERKPFFGGTYFPPVPRHGMPGFPELLRGIQAAWADRRDHIERSADELTGHVRSIAAGLPAGTDNDIPGVNDISRAITQFSDRFDVRWGGFGSAPKFPPDQALRLLLREYHRERDDMVLRIATFTLDRMALGGMYDHVGGGFARYSVDERWLVPHFEKMLYNQALLVPVYADAWVLTGVPLYRRVVEQTLDFVRREMTDPGGGLYSSLDADSEGVEGRFYVWTPEQITSVLGRTDGEWFGSIYGITDSGNFEGASIPNLLDGDLASRASELGITEAEIVSRLAPLREALLDARGNRTRPGTDDKILTAWNGLTVTAFSRAFEVLGRDEDLASARAAADFVLDRLYENGRLLVSHRGGRSRLNGYLDDHAFMARALVDLYEACFEPRYLDTAASIADTLLDRYEDREGGGFFFVSDDHETLLARSRSSHDGAIPSGTGVAIEVLLRLAVLLDHRRYRDAATHALRASHPSVERGPSGFTSLLCAAGLADARWREVGIVGDLQDPATLALVSRVHRRYLPDRVLAAGCGDGGDDELPLLRGKSTVDGSPAAYVCRNYSCRNPVTDPDDLDRLLE